MISQFVEPRGYSIQRTDEKGKGRGKGAKGGKPSKDRPQSAERPTLDPKTRACRFEDAKTGSCERGKTCDSNHDKDFVEKARKQAKDSKPKGGAKAKAGVALAVAAEACRDLSWLARRRRPKADADDADIADAMWVAHMCAGDHRGASLTHIVRRAPRTHPA